MLNQVFTITLLWNVKQQHYFLPFQFKIFVLQKMSFTPKSFAFVPDNNDFRETEAADIERAARYGAEEQCHQKIKQTECADLATSDNGNYRTPNATTSNDNCGNDDVEDDDFDIDIAQKKPTFQMVPRKKHLTSSQIMLTKTYTTSLMKVEMEPTFQIILDMTKKVI